MGKLKELLKSTLSHLFVVFSGIAFFVLLTSGGVIKGALSAVWSLLAPIIAGLVIAYIVNIPSTLLQNSVFSKLRNRRAAEIISGILACLLSAGVIAAICLLVLPKAADGVSTLISNLGRYYRDFVENSPGMLKKLGLPETAGERLRSLLSSLEERASQFALGAAPKLIDYTFATFGLAANAVLAVAFGISCLFSKNRLLAHARRFIRAAFCPENSNRVMEVCSFSNTIFRSYITGRMIDSIVLGLFCYIGMRILGMPYPETISAAIAAFALIPILGPWISTLGGAFMILTASPNEPISAVWFMIMILIIQQIDDSVISPRITSNAVGLSGAWVLFAVIIGGRLFKIPGLLFAVPVTAVIYRLAADWTNERAKSRGVPIVETVPSAGFDIKGRRKDPRVHRPFFSGRNGRGQRH